MISFIVQGPTNYVSENLFGIKFNEQTFGMNEGFTSQSCIDSLRKFYPGCEIILSCTTGDAENISGADQLFYTSDNELEDCQNINRQILSSRTVKYAKNEVVCKIRSDMVAVSNNLLPYIEKLNSKELITNRIQTHKMFTNYVLISNWSVDRNHYYHPSDFFFLGMKNDVSSIFEIPQRIGRKWQVGPEQYIALRCMENHNLNNYIDYDWLKDHGSNNTHLGENVHPDKFYIDNWWKVFYNNYYVLDLGFESGLISQKYPERVTTHPNLVNSKDWKAGHERYIK